MKKNEASTKVAEPTVVPQDPIVPATPAPEAPVAPVQANTISTPIDVQTATPGTSTNVFTNLLTKLKAFGVGPVVTIAAIAVVLVGVIIFSVASSTPKSVFKNAINTMYKGANVAIEGYETYLEDYDITEHALLVDGTLTLETNISDMSEYNLNKMTIGFNAGVDYKNEVLSLGGSLKGNKETVKLNAQVQKNEAYITSSLFKEVLKLDSDMMSELGLDIDFEDLKEEIEELQKEYNTDPETYDYLVKTFRDVLVKSINSDYMEKEKDEIDVLDKEIKVKKYSYVFDEDAVQDLLTKIADELLEEEDFAKTFADAFGVDKKDVKEMLKELKKSAKDIEFDEEIALNIYTRGLFNSYAGMGFEIEGKEYFSIYTDGKNVEMTYDDHIDGDYGTKVVVTLEKDGKGYKGVVKENKEKLLEMNFKEVTDEVIDSEFVIYEDGDKLGTIKLYLKAKETKEGFSTDYEFRITETGNNEYIGFKGNYNLAIKDKVEKINGKNAVGVDELDVDQVTENVEKIIENDEALGSLLEEAIGEVEKEMLDLNGNGMVEITSSEVADILAKNKATVLYVGKSSYSEYYDEDKYDLLNNLKDLQEELGFYSYYLSEYSVTTEFNELVKDVQYTCPTTGDTTGSTTGTGTTTTPCIGYPAIYLIKDGKVVKAFRQTVTYADLSAALSEIGIN